MQNRHRSRSFVSGLPDLDARLELVAVFEDDDKRVPIHLGREAVV